MSSLLGTTTRTPRLRAPSQASLLLPPQPSRPAARGPPDSPAVPAGTPASREENPTAAGPEEADAILAAPSPSAASLPFNPALPFLGIESSPRLFTEPAFCGLLRGVVQAPGPAQDRTTCPAWGRAPVSRPPSNSNSSPPKRPSLASGHTQAGCRPPGVSARASRKETAGGGRPESERASALLLLPNTACLSPAPLLRSGWAAKEIPALRVRASFLRLPPSNLRGSRANPEGPVGHVYITSHPEDASGGSLVPTVAR